MKTDPRVERLHRLYKTNENAKRILEWMGARAKNSSETLLDRFVDAVDLPRIETINVLRHFEDIGLGKFIVGRRGSPSRFAWAVGLVTAGQTAQGKMDVLEILPDLDGPSATTTETVLATTSLGHNHQAMADTISIELTPDQVRLILQKQLERMATK